MSAVLRTDGVTLPEGVTPAVADLTDTARARDALSRLRPDVIIHVAAMANIDACETTPAAATRINVEATRMLLDVAESCNAHFVFVSTDTVFDGHGSMYSEDAEPNPLNHYGRTKVEAERLVRTYDDDSWTIVRPSLIMGFPAGATGNSFLPTMLGHLRAGDPVFFPSSEYRTPVDSITLSRALLEIAEHTISGVFHIAGNERMDRLTMARRIARHFGLPAHLVRDTTERADTKGHRAPRPADVSLDNAKARAALQTPMVDFDLALRKVSEQGT